ncbi:MAG: polysaccharide biosynthesis protein, partial [Bacteroidota bacterium]
MERFRKNIPRWIIFAIDLLIVAFGVLLAFMIRFDFGIPEDNERPLLLLIAIAVVIRSIYFLAFGIHSGIVRYTSTHDVVKIFFAIIAGTITLLIINFITLFSQEFFLFPNSIIAMEFFVTLVGIVSYRILVKIAFMEMENPKGPRRKVIIYGAGNNGMITKRTIDRDAGSKYQVLAMIDDNADKTGKKLEGVPIYSSARLYHLLINHDIAHLILSVSDIEPEKKQQFVDWCLETKTKVLTVPPASKWINGELSFKQIKKINIEDLLERDIIRLDEDNIKQELTGQKVLVTGAAGSIGSEIVRQLCQYKISELILIDNAETPLHHLSLELNEIAADIDYRVILADIRYKAQMETIFSTYQ